MMRRHFICREMTYDWRENLPDGYIIRSMEISQLIQADLQIPSELKTTLGQWMSFTDDDFQDFGFVAIHINQVVSWSTVDFVAAGKGDLGFETLPEFRQRGLGSTVAAAALEHGITKGLEIHWTCAEDNLGSQRTAEKLGLKHQRDYPMYVFALDIHTHMAQLAYSKLANGEHRESIKLYEQLFAQKADVPTWAYFDTAQGYAAIGEADNALRYLRMAAKQGWSAVEMTEQAAEFGLLHKSPEWDIIVSKIRKNRKN
jgi:RimJ/RimL family protein N-acetyltransferase